MNDMLVNLALAIVLLPLSAYFIQTAVGDRLPRQGDWLSTGAIFGSFLCALRIFGEMWSSFDPAWVVQKTWTWMDLSTLNVPWKLEVGVRLDNISATMLLMVTLCATLIHLFSTGYMRDHHGKPEDGYRYTSFFSYLSLFTAAMLGLVISDNFFTLFMAWEVMGLCSYLLIGFYRHKPSAANASLKAFMTTRVGDLGLFLGLLAMFAIIKSFRFDDVYEGINSGAFSTETILGVSAAFFIGLGIFIGTVGKSAQFPLQIWLPDAMEGPTPVSALIHAATMVSAGIYLIIRIFPMLEFGGVLPIVAYVGGFTCFFAAILAIKQNDIKKVLAYSTLSQLGYMVLALGVGAYSVGFFHLITHAVFKACLFMASGAVIYAMHHEQDMRHMGGLKKKLPITFACMLITTLAISGVPGFSGFASKDLILGNVMGYAHLHPQHYLLVFFGFATAAMTAFYMFRLIFMTFWGEPHDHHHYDEAHEVSWNMWLPLAILASLSFCVVYTGSITGLGFDKIFGNANEWILKLNPAPMVEGAEQARLALEEAAHHAHVPTMILSIIFAGAGILFSYLVYGSKKISAAKLESLWPRFVQKAIDNLYYFDAFYIKVVIKKLFLPLSDKNAKFDDAVIDRVMVDGWKDVTMVGQKASGIFDDMVIDGVMVDGAGGAFPTAIGSSLRHLQNGKVQRYLMVAVVALMLLFLFRGVV
jgi:NADH-quinone oxidoreductase subunit L